MPRMHGEHHRDWLRRQQTDAARRQATVAYQPQPVEVETPCFCAARPFPHFHSPEERRDAAERFRRDRSRR